MTLLYSAVRADLIYTRYRSQTETGQSSYVATNDDVPVTDTSFISTTMNPSTWESNLGLVYSF